MTIRLNMCKKFFYICYSFISAIAICQIPRVILESASNISFKFCINLQCYLQLSVLDITPLYFSRLVNSLMNITIDLKFIFIIDAFREYNSHLQDITS